MKKAFLIGAMLLCTAFADNAFAGNRIVIFDNVATEVAAPSIVLPGSEDL